VFPLFLISCCYGADDLQTLAEDFWTWRAATQPFSGDDIPRIERRSDTLPNWSAAAMDARRRALADFKSRWQKLDPHQGSTPQQVDYRLIGSAIARVNWELDIEQGWLRNPGFYVDQTVGSVFDALLSPGPITPQRTRIVEHRLQSIPQTIQDAKANLSAGRMMNRPFAELAIESLKDIRGRMAKIPVTAPDAIEKASAALEDFRGWLADKLPQLPEKTAVGREAYLFFLGRVALIPFTPEELLSMGRQEWERSVSFETYERNRNHGLPQLSLFPNVEAQIARESDEELAVRRFLESRNVLSVPGWMRHYRNQPLPDYLAALEMGVTDDLTGPTRLQENAVSYVRPPSLNLGYFALASARDPRPILVHEGIPGHYFQLALSWAHEDPVRRHYYDSSANEGIGFYAEEMMLQAGYFDDSPRTREIIYNFMRLRALRVEVDVKLALGLFTIEQGAHYLETTVPMDHSTALHEAADFARSPGQAISYQIGKIQIMRMLAAARRKEGENFDLRRFHDFVWKNGNVPIALQQWELLGDANDVPALPPRN
jgi:Bacterial protein of unknown function (DUF885)